MSWDLFIAHAAADTQAAEELYGLLSGELRCFLDTRCLIPGDDWDLALPEAQRESSVTLVLISSRTPAAYYQREEIAQAIALARGGTHRVIPIYLEGWPRDPALIPYGLRIKQGLMAPDLGGMAGVAEKLRQTWAALKARAPRPPS